MAIFRITESSIERVTETTFAQEKVLERHDLQRLLKADISVLATDLMVVEEEYREWEDSSRRIDLLCLDKEAHLVVVELKRTEDGGHMELQAIRYAAMVSSMTFEQLVDAHAHFLGGEDAHQKAQSAILRFLDFESTTDAKLSDEVKIVLVSANFSVELTTAVLWLNKRGLDISCIRLKPYRLDGQVLMDIQQLIPLPEAVEYETKIRTQQQESRLAESSRHEMFRRFWKQLIERTHGKTALFAGRTGSKDQWIGVSIGRTGFNLNVVLRRDDSRVECYIDMGEDSDERNLTALKHLEHQKERIESAFGGQLDWQELQDSRACRICKEIQGGWGSPEGEWPELQDRLIDAAVRLEKALKIPIQALQLP
ncbi:MAG: hypothetical protein JWN74_2146 [Acidobacteriaceae bacterium]|nr:hypothetical protein [Acidobacteriaceae bacterium]